MEKVITTKNDNYYMKSNAKIVDDINYKKKLKQAKEVKDLENIFKKWNSSKGEKNNNNIDNNNIIILFFIFLKFIFNFCYFIIKSS